MKRTPIFFCQIVFDVSRFFPTVEEFVSAVKDDAQFLALHEWEVCVLAASRANREMIAGLSPKGQSALHLVGELYKLGIASEEQLVWIKKEFVGVWKSSSADNKSLPASHASAPIQLDLVAHEYVSYISQTAIAIVPELQEVAGQHEQLVM
jgi:hypothetical protein